MNMRLASDSQRREWRLSSPLLPQQWFVTYRSSNDRDGRETASIDTRAPRVPRTALLELRVATRPILDPPKRSRTMHPKNASLAEPLVRRLFTTVAKIHP